MDNRMCTSVGIFTNRNKSSDDEYIIYI